MAEDLKPQNIQVSHQSSFNNLGQVTQTTRVQFFVGTQGPFTLSFPQGQDTPDAIKAGIQAQVDKVRMITTF